MLSYFQVLVTLPHDPAQKVTLPFVVVQVRHHVPVTHHIINNVQGLVCNRAGRNIILNSNNVSGDFILIKVAAGHCIGAIHFYDHVVSRCHLVKRQALVQVQPAVKDGDVNLFNHFRLKLIRLNSPLRG